MWMRCAELETNELNYIILNYETRASEFKFDQCKILIAVEVHYGIYKVISDLKL